MYKAVLVFSIYLRLIGMYNVVENDYTRTVCSVSCEEYAPVERESSSRYRHRDLTRHTRSLVTAARSTTSLVPVKS